MLKSPSTKVVEESPITKIEEEEEVFQFFIFPGEAGISGYPDSNSSIETNRLKYGLKHGPSKETETTSSKYSSSDK